MLAVRVRRDRLLSGHLDEEPAARKVSAVAAVAARWTHGLTACMTLEMFCGRTRSPSTGMCFLNCSVSNGAAAIVGVRAWNPRTPPQTDRRSTALTWVEPTEPPFFSFGCIGVREEPLAGNLTRMALGRRVVALLLALAVAVHAHRCPNGSDLPDALVNDDWCDCDTDEPGRFAFAACDGRARR